MVIWAPSTSHSCTLVDVPAALPYSKVAHTRRVRMQELYDFERRRSPATGRPLLRQLSPLGPPPSEPRSGPRSAGAATSRRGGFSELHRTSHCCRLQCFALTVGSVLGQHVTSAAPVGSTAARLKSRALSPFLLLSTLSTLSTASAASAACATSAASAASACGAGGVLAGTPPQPRPTEPMAFSLLFLRHSLTISGVATRAVAGARG